MEQRRKGEALGKLKAARDKFQDLSLREENLRMDLDLLDAESLAASEKLEMLQARLAVATGELQMVESNIVETERGTIPQGKLPGLPSQTSQSSTKNNALTSLLKTALGHRDDRSKVDVEKDIESIEVYHDTQKCNFSIEASYTFYDLVIDASRYWDLPAQQCVIVSRELHRKDAFEQIWPKTAFVKYELEKSREREEPKQRYELQIKPDDAMNFSDVETHESSSSEEETETQRRRRLLRERLINPAPKVIMRELFVYLAFMILWLVLLFMRRNVEDANLMVAATREALVNEEFTDDLILSYPDIAEPEELYTWLEEVIEPSFYSTEDYNEQEMDPRDRYKLFNYGIPVGSFELKQYRVRNDSCALNWKTQNTREEFKGMYYVPACYDKYSGGARDTESYGPSSYITNQTDDGTGFTFHFQTPYDYNVFIPALYGNYPAAEAYIREIPYNDVDAYRESLNFLKDNNWIDRATRAIMVSILVYHPNFDSYVACQFILERPQSGLFYPRFQFKVIKMTIFTNWFTDIAFMIIEIIIYCMSLYYFLREINEMKLYWRGFRSIMPYWSNVFNFTDWLIIIFMSVTVILRVGFYLDPMRKDFSPFQGLADMAPELQSQQATKLQVLALAYDLAFQLDSLLICFMFFKLFKFFRLSPQLNMLWFTLGRAAKDLSILTFMATLMMIGFAAMANNLFGADLLEYRTFFQSVSTLLKILIGTFDYYILEKVSRLWAPLFFFAYVIFMYFVILNVFLAILNDSYLAEKKIFMIKYGEASLNLTSTRNVQELARFAVLYMQDKQRNRKMAAYEKKRAAAKEKERREEQEAKRKTQAAEKKRRKAEKEALKEKRRIEEESKTGFEQN